jgi:beta-glucanase (GH16 family)
MSYLRAFVALVLAAALTPLLLTAPGTAAPATTDATATTAMTASSAPTARTMARAKARKGQSARLTVLPKVAHTGKGAKPADRAKAVGEIKVSPAQKGRKIVVQRSSNDGASWSNAAKTTTNDRGYAYFKPAAAPAGGFYTYRAKVKRFKGKPAFETGRATDRWSLLFQDQFNARSLDRSVWKTRGDYYDKKSMRKCSKASPKMAKVGKGVLTLKVKKDGSRRGDVCKWRSPGGKTKKFNYYLNGHIGTDQSFSFRYGVAAARVKFQQPQGMHGSFWKNTSGEPEGRHSVEIDTVEFFGKGYNKGGLAQFLHYKGRKIGGLQPSANDVLKRNDNWWKKYHVFSVEWTPQGYSFRIDGTETYRTSKAVSDKQVIAILSLLSSDWELDKMPKSGKGSMKVDWLRVWQDQSIAARNLQ